MRQHQPHWQRLILLLIGMATLIIVAAYKATGLIDWQGVWVGVSKVTLISACVYGAWEAFRRWLWRWRVFQGWLVDVPDLNGRWKGSATSSFVGPDTSEPTEIPVTVEITQKYTSVNIRLVPQSGTSTSHSIAASFVHDPEAHRCRLVYTYLNEPKLSETDLDRHFGSVVLEVEGSPASKMRGSYMTDRKVQTKGDIELTREASVATPAANGRRREAIL